MGLKEYKAKRNFTRTAEPAGRLHGARQAKRLFVVQKHAATRLHYDFRLQMEGVLKSWAVPKGFPTMKGDRRLAVEVEDHPLEYADFEGTIPEGNYGAGTVMVWDTGTYEVSGDNPGQALRSGKLHLWLKGKKLKGEWTLVRMRRLRESDKPQWLLLKTGEGVPSFSAQAENRSAVTRRTLEQIAAAEDRVWNSNRPAVEQQTRFSNRLQSRAEADTAPRSARVRGRSGRAGTEPKPPPRRRETQGRTLVEVPGVDLAKLPRSRPAFVPPMKALLVDTLPRGEEWLCELKFDGVRALAVKTPAGVRLLSRANRELTAEYGELAAELQKLPVREAVLDGEIVAVDAEGRPSFQLLQGYRMTPQKPPLLYYVFDALNLEGKDLTGLQLEARKGVAERVIAGISPMVRFSSALKADSERVMEELRKRGLEGLVAKRKDSTYEPGRRSGAWVKYKWTNQQEFVIGGYTEPQGARSYFGAVLVGYYQKGKLLFAAKVGTGFDERLLASLYKRFQQLLRPDCPFANLPEKPGAGRFGGGLTAAQMRKCTWLEPKLVCEVRFSEWTRDNHLRQPAFLGLREDKKPEEVIREAAGAES